MQYVNEHPTFFVWCVWLCGVSMQCILLTSMILFGLGQDTVAHQIYRSMLGASNTWDHGLGIFVVNLLDICPSQPIL